MEKESLEWHAPLYHHNQKGASWYTTIILVSLVVFGISYYVGNILFGLFVLIAGGAFIILGKTDPGIARFKIDERGVIVKNTLYPFSELDSFWVEHNTLYIKTDKTLSPHVVLPLGDIPTEDVVAFLEEYLPKEEYERNIIDSIAEYINF